MMAIAALRPMLTPRYPTRRVLALPRLVALRHVVRGQSASADAALLGVLGLGFALSDHVMVR